MKPQLSLLTIATLAVLPLTAMAAGRVVMETEGGQQNAIEFDGGKIRMDLGANADGESYMVLRDGHIYNVTVADGQAMVLDLNAVGKMLGGMARQSANVGSEANTVYSIEDTGRTETVAGIDGRVFIATYTDESGATQTQEMVIGKSPVLREYSESMATWGRAAAQSFGIATDAGDKAQQLVFGEGDGILRFGTSFRMVSVDGASLAAARFDLPAAPQEMPNLGALVSGQEGAAAEEAPAQGGLGGLLGGVLNRQSERQKERVEDRTGQAVDGVVDQAVDRGVGKALDKLFGN